MYFRKTLAATLIEITKGVLLESKLIENGGVNVPKMMRLFYRIQSYVVGGSNRNTAANAAPCQEHAEGRVIVIAPFAALRFGSTTELAAPNHQCRIEQSTLLQIF